MTELPRRTVTSTMAHPTILRSLRLGSFIREAAAPMNVGERVHQGHSKLVRAETPSPYARGARWKL
jgi:hypothetical protein